MTDYSRDLEAAFDLRAFLDRLQGTKELKVIHGAHWDLEIGALSEIFAEQLVPPALLFDDVAEHSRGYRVVSNVLFSPRREALALGLASDLQRLDIVKWVKGRLGPVDIHLSQIMVATKNNMAANDSAVFS